MAIYDINANVLYDANAVTNLYTDSPSFYRFATDSGTIQGGCTDGTYIYYIITSSNKLVKLDIATGTKTTVTYESGLYGHGNDMTYNPATGKIYVVTMENGVIRQVNPFTLVDEGEIVPLDADGNIVTSSGLAYDRKNGQYIISSGDSYTIFDSSWTFIKSFTLAAGARWTYQGLETDGTYIFRPIWVFGTYECNILVLDMDGNAQTQIILPALESKEIETLINDWNGAWYAIYNGSPAVYLMGLPKNTTLHAVETIHKILNRT